MFVGHSFSGMILTNAGVHSKVSALVHVAARAPDAGEDYTALAGRFPAPPAPATTHAAWREKPSFYAVSTEDRTINPNLERFMAKRMGAKTIEVKAGHLSLMIAARRNHGLDPRGGRSNCVTAGRFGSVGRLDDAADY